MDKLFAKPAPLPAVWSVAVASVKVESCFAHTLSAEEPRVAMVIAIGRDIENNVSTSVLRSWRSVCMSVPMEIIVVDAAETIWASFQVIFRNEKVAWASARSAARSLVQF